MSASPERWQLVHDGHEHVVTIADARLRRRLTWLVDGTEQASTTTSDERVVLDGGERGAVGILLPTFTGPARRVTWHGPDSPVGAAVAAQTGLGGVDLDPEPGSKAAAREEWIRAHPNLHAARRTATALAGVLLPLLALWLLARIDIPWPSIPWPDWDLPSIPWPDLSIPWPDWDLPDLPALPAWVRELLNTAKYVGPVIVAFVMARAEVRRRRAQDERKRHTPDDGGTSP